jgi:two-component system response regulator AtoC
VDDEPAVRFTLSEIVTELGHAAIECASGREALGRIHEADVVLTDLVMPGMDGLELLKSVRALDPDVPVLMLTARGSERTAVAAMKAGAWDYLQKPSDLDAIAAVIERAIEARTLRRDARRHAVERTIGRELVGESPRFRQVMRDAERVARRDVPVLLRGESGTGKELIAALIHASSPRASAPFVRFNCGAIPGELAEAELFGHAKGAFTGAHQARRGFFAQADGGTLLLDEVGELPLALQPKLLRVLQEGEIQPVGAGRVERVDVRVIAATHRDLARDSREGRFRQDLYYRLAVVELALPSLAERRDDIPALVECFRQRYARRFGLDAVSFTPAFLDALARRDFPGNIRELENAVARVLALSTGGLIDVEALECLSPGQSSPSVMTSSLRERVAAFERGLLEEALRDARGNQSEAARRLGLTRVTLIDKLKRHGILRRPDEA